MNDDRDRGVLGCVQLELGRFVVGDRKFVIDAEGIGAGDREYDLRIVDTLQQQDLGGPFLVHQRESGTCFESGQPARELDDLVGADLQRAEHGTFNLHLDSPLLRNGSRFEL